MNVNKQLTENFKLREFLISKFYNEDQQAKVLASVTPEVLENIQELAENLQVLRDVVKEPIKINIAFRPKWWELERGRSGRSQHVFGRAADIKVSNVNPFHLYLIVKRLISKGKMKQGGIGLYDTFLHYDIRGHKARWDYSKQYDL